MPAKRLGLAWVVALAAMLVTFDVRAAFEFRDDGWEGTSELLELARQQLGKERVQLVAALDYGAAAKPDGE